MKIRTDFVTNSSSSSFVVEIDFYGKDNSFPVFKRFTPSVDGDGEPNLNCTAEELMNADNLDSLLNILRGAIRDEHFGYFDDQYKKEMQSFTDQVAKSFPDLTDISRIKLERRWSAWGEMASCMIWNNEELKELCKAVCSASNKEDKQTAIEALKDYLDYEPAQAYGEAVDWPTGFLGSKVNGSFVWDSSPEQLARYVCADMISPNDNADEVTVIDMENRTIEQSARYELQRTGELPPDEHDLQIKGTVLIKYKGPGGDVVIPDGVTVIGTDAFEKCAGLESVTMPDSVREIRWRAFKGCSSLESITIPDSVTEIGSKAFEGCIKLADDNGMFVVNGILCNYFGTGSVVIPDSVTKISACAFSGCSSLKDITIPDGVTEIGASTFEGCSSLESFTIPDGVRKISFGTFKGCSSLESVTIPDSVTEISSDAFKGCSSLKYVKIPDGVTEIGASTFEGCSSLESFTIPDGVRKISFGTFKGCSSLESVMIPDSVTEISSDAFKGCIKLADDNGLVIVKDILFDYFGTGGSVVIPYNVNRVIGNALSSKNITHITFMGKPDSIEVDEFGRLSGIKAAFPQGAFRTSKTLSAEWLSLRFDADETDLAYLIMYQKSKGWLDYVCSNSGDPALVIERLIELMSTKKKVSKAVSENVAVYLRRHYASVPRERISWLMEYLSDNKGKESDALRNDPGFKRYMSGEKAPEPAAPEKSFSRPSASDRCAGMTFVITGKVNIFVNRSEFTEYVKAHGGKVSGSVTAKTDYLVNNDINSASSKNRTAKSLGVPIISEEEFVKRFGKPRNNRKYVIL